MSFNKSKAMRNAERYLTQGKIQAAISEYRQIVENEPKDINSRNMLGDLYIKASDNQAAVNCYKEVAEHYNLQGFAKKAIAIYNKIYRLEPDSLEIALKLADLYQTRGSLAEAQQHYDEIAKRYEKKGRKVEALAIWEKIADIAPRDTEIYLKIADAYWQDERKSEAAEAFVQAGSRFLEAENFQSAATAFSRSLEVNPEDFFAVRGFVKAQNSLGYPEEGAKLLEAAIEKQPFNKEINYLLMDCYFEMDDLQKAEELILKLVEREPTNYPKLVELSKLYTEKDDLDSAIRLLTMTSEHQLVSGESDELHELLNEVLAKDPEHIECLRLLSRYHGWLRDETHLKQTLERLADAARLNNSVEDERYALSQYLTLSPHDAERSNRLKEINDLYGLSNEIGQIEQLMTTEAKEVPNFESFASLSGVESSNDNGFEFVDEQNISVGEHFESSENGEMLSSAEQFAEEYIQETEDYDAEVLEDAESMDFEEVITSEIPEDDDAEDLSPADEMKLDEQIESVRFYIEQGYTNLAEKALEEVENDFGYRQEVIQLREILFGSGTVVEQTFEEEVSPQIVDDENVQTPVSVDEFETASETLEEVQEEFEPESVEVEKVTEITEEVVEEVSETTEEVFESETESVEETEETDAQVADEEISADADESLAEENASTTVEMSQSDDLSNSFESFKNELGLEDADEVQSEDFEENYQRAVVYQEMGMLEEALREFQDAIKCVTADDGTRRFFNCCTLIGHCFMEKGMPNPALQWFLRAFETPALSDDEKQALDYEIANAYEAIGEIEKAFEQFELIYAMDVGYRDVGERMEKLREKIPTYA